MTKGFRVILWVAVVVAVFAFGAGTLLAADGGWSGVTVDKNFRGPGNYLSLLKILSAWLLFLLWVYTTDWLSTDCQDVKLNYQQWNPIVCGSFLAAFVLLWLLPSFWIGFPLLLIAYVAPLATYIVLRNKQVDNNKRVLTPEHLRYWFAINLNRVGMKISTERPDPQEVGLTVKLLASGGSDDRTNTARLLMARQSPGFRTAREILGDCMEGRASAIMLDYSQQGVAIRSMVDGVWLQGETISREQGDPAIEALKLICGLNPKDRQNRQVGTFVAERKSVPYTATLTSQGTPGGERAVMQFDEKKIQLKTLDELGMRPKLQEQLMDLIRLKQGFSFFSAPPGNGLRTSTDVILRGCDRYIREFAALEEDERQYPPVENIPVTTYKTIEGQTPLDVLPRLFRTEPSVVVVRDLVDAPTLNMLCDEAANHRMIIGTIRAKDCSEALLRVLALGVAPATLAKVATMVVCQRLVRKLCESCKEAYTPPPQVLQQLGIPAGRVQAFYRPPQPNPEEPKPPCTVCNGIGYFGRTAIFEVLPIGDAVRKVLNNEPKLELLRQAARKDGMKSLQEEGVLLVVKGVTSLPELMRALK
jgi:type II secretory ATPase GspE/PulE/Tfp pilus assembly ATPase PilB-like protein